MSQSDEKTVQALEQRIATLEAELKSTRDDVNILKSAVSFLSMQSSGDAHHGGGGAKKPYASQTMRLPKSQPTHNGDAADKSSPTKSVSPSPTSRPPTAQRTPNPAAKPQQQHTPTAAADKTPELKRYGTLQGKKTPTAHEEKKDVPVPKVIQARTPSKDNMAGADDIDPARKGHYLVNGKKIFYVLPPEFAGKDHKPAAPGVTVQLEHAYGYNGRVARDNLFFTLDKQEIVYCLAGAGVVMNVASGAQRFFTGHTEDILCLAVHPNRPLAATGQRDPKGASTPFICIWDYSTMQLVRKITFHDRGVCCVAFSNDGKYLASIGEDDSHTLAVWDWENSGTSAEAAAAAESKVSNKKPAQDTPLIERMCSKDDVFAIVWNPDPSTAVDEKKDDFGTVDQEFVTVGVKVFKVWQLSNIDAKDKKQRKIRDRLPGTMEQTKMTQKAYHCVAYTSTGDYWVGTQSGHAYCLKGSHLNQFVQAHETDKIVGVIRKIDGGFASVGDDGKLKLWDEDFKSSSDIDLSGYSAGEVVKVRAMDFANGQLVLGTKNNEVLRVDLQSRQVTVLIEGHHADVWGLAVHPLQPVVASGAQDKTIRLWNYQTHSAGDKKLLKCSDKVRSLIFTPDGTHLIAGLWSGKLVLYSFPALDLVWEKKVSIGETIDALAVSPDSSLVAVGSWDQMIYLLQIPSGKVLQTFKGHTSSVLMVDFSEDGQALMSNSKDYEILYWDVVKGKRITNVKEFCDIKWYGWHCFLGWPVQGIWAETGDGTDINAVCRSEKQTFLATGDDFGRVRVYKYPVIHKDSPAEIGLGHCSHVTNVRFSHDDTFLFSAGGADTALFQWKLV